MASNSDNGKQSTCQLCICIFVMLAAVVCVASGEDAGYEGGDMNARYVRSTLKDDMSPGGELVLDRGLAQILQNNPLLYYLSAAAMQEQAEDHQGRLKRLAGLENLDLMAGILSKAHHRGAALSHDLRDQMRLVGRGKK